MRLELEVLQYLGFVTLVMMISQIVLKQEYLTMLGMKSTVIGIIVLIIFVAFRYWYQNKYSCDSKDRQ